MTGLPSKGALEHRTPEFAIARSIYELERAFELCYRSYHKSGLVVENPSGMRLTPYHLLNGSEVLIGKLDKVVFSTMSFFCDGELGLPMEKMYRSEIEGLRDQGLRIAEVGSLADRRTSSRRYIESFIKLGRLLAQASSARGIDTLVVAVHPKHARLYRRMMGFQQMGDHTQCPYANGNPAEALYLRFDQLSPKIEEQFFGDPLSAEELKPYQWTCETQEYFDRVLQSDGKIAKLTKLKNYYHWDVGSSNQPRSLPSALPDSNQTTPSSVSMTKN